MASYMLYFPGKTSPNPQHFAAAGLEELLRPDDHGPDFFECRSGTPDKGPGIFATWRRDGGDNDVRLAYDPALQHWEPCPADPARKLPAGRYWLGRVIDRPITPADLARQVQLPGPLFAFDDGQEWQLPCVLDLPHRFSLNAGGQEIRTVKPQYDAIYQRGLWALQTAEDYLLTNVIDGTACRQYVAEMLAQNYRINWTLCQWLGLFDDGNWFVALAKTTDMQRLLRIQDDLKKKRAAVTPPG